MALSSSSTYDDAIGQYRDNAGYRRADSPSQALLFAEACRWLMAEPSSSQKGNNSVTFRLDLLKDEAEQAERFAKFSGQGAVGYADFSAMRSV